MTTCLQSFSAAFVVLTTTLAVASLSETDDHESELCPLVSYSLDQVRQITVADLSLEANAGASILAKHVPLPAKSGIVDQIQKSLPKALSSQPYKGADVYLSPFQILNPDQLHRTIQHYGGFDSITSAPEHWLMLGSRIEYKQKCCIKEVRFGIPLKPEVLGIDYGQTHFIPMTLSDVTVL